jgi:hypothetical protein
MTETAPAAPAPANDTGEIVARADSWYRRKWILIGLFALGWGWWSLYDGYVKYPRLNREAIEDARRQGKPDPEKLPHGGYDVPLNRVIGWSLQPLGAFILFWGFYSSRGQYRFTGDTLHVPGHPPVSIDAIRAIDESKWDRKGIAYIDYDVNGTRGRLKLDDYAYEREPTDQIHDRILAAVTPVEARDAGSPDGGPTG